MQNAQFDSELRNLRTLTARRNAPPGTTRIVASTYTRISLHKQTEMDFLRSVSLDRHSVLSCGRTLTHLRIARRTEEYHGDTVFGERQNGYRLSG